MKQLLVIALVLFAAPVAVAETPLALQANWFAYPGYPDTAYICATRQGGTAPFLGTIAKDGQTVVVFTPNDTNQHCYPIQVEGRATVLVTISDANGSVSQSLNVYTGPAR